MAAKRETGLGALPTGLLRPTTPRPPEPVEEAATTGADPRAEAVEGDEAPAEGPGRGVAEARPARTRRKRPPVSGETRGRKLHLPDGIHDRLWLLARQRRQSVSAVAAEILDRNLPRFRVEREG